MIDNIMTKYFCESKREAELIYEKREYYKGDYVYVDDLEDYEYNDFAKQVSFYSYLLNDKKLNYQLHKLMINIEEERKAFLKSLYLDFIKYLLKFYFKKDIFDDEELNDSYEVNIYYINDDLKLPLYDYTNYEFELINPNNFYMIDSYEVLMDYLFNVNYYNTSFDITRDNSLIRHIDLMEVKLSLDSNKYRFVNPYLCIKEFQVMKDIPIDDLVLELNFNEEKDLIRKAVQYKRFDIILNK